jgi:hypothetical protein
MRGLRLLENWNSGLPLCCQVAIQGGLKFTKDIDKNEGL